MQGTQRIRQLPMEWKKLNLGCNFNNVDGWINVDIQDLDGVDIVANLEEQWPWEDNSIHYIRAFDIFEHLRDPIHSMNEAWRVLGHGGILEVWVPSTDGRGAFQDPTHVSFWNRNSFFYYSQKYFAKLYPGRIRCDFNFVLLDSNMDDSRVVWTWALCRANKGPDQEQYISDQWFRALSHTDPSQRIMPGYDGSSLGTTEQN